MNLWVEITATQEAELREIDNPDIELNPPAERSETSDEEDIDPSRVLQTLDDAIDHPGRFETLQQPKMRRSSDEEEARLPVLKEPIGGPRQPVVNNLTDATTNKADPIRPRNGMLEQAGRYETPDRLREGCSSDDAGARRSCNLEESAGRRKITEPAESVIPGFEPNSPSGADGVPIGTDESASPSNPVEDAAAEDESARPLEPP